MADRYDCRKIIQLAQLMYMGVSAAWAFLFWTDTIEVWHACLLLTIHGMAGVLWAPGSQLLIHDIVGTEHHRARSVLMRRAGKWGCFSARPSAAP